jgi:hypothetical protein
VREPLVARLKTMTTANNNSLYKLLDIKADSGKMLLLIFPPIYALWLLAIGKRLLQKQNKPDKTFTFFATGTVALFTVLLIFAPILKLLHVDIIVNGEKAIPILLTFYFFWFGTTGMLSNLTIKHERLSTPDRYYNLADKIDYVKRFLAFFYWPFSIWSYQRTVNEYNR